MAPRKTTEPQSSGSPVKRRRAATRLDKDHEFLLLCLIESNCRINFVAVAERHGYTEKSAQNRFYRLKNHFMSQHYATNTETIQKHKKPHIKKENAGVHTYAIHTGDTEITEDVENPKIKQEDQDDDLASESN